MNRLIAEIEKATKSKKELALNQCKSPNAFRDDHWEGDYWDSNYWDDEYGGDGYGGYPDNDTK